MKILVASSLLLSSFAWADRPHWSVQQFLFNQSLNMDTVYDVTSSKPENLISTMKKHGVQVLLVKTVNPTKALNPLLANLPLADAELLKKAEFQDSYEGRMIPKTNPCCDLKQDTLLVRDTALSYTVIHEFLHSALTLNTPSKHKDLENQFDSTHRKMSFYQKKLFNDPYLLINANWRRDILQVDKDLSEMIYDRLQMGQSQEAIIEKVLSKYIDAKNPYYDKARQEQGYKYGENMINNMIDIYNSVDYSLTWSRNTVAGIRDAVETGDIDKSEEKKITKKDAQAFADGVQNVLKDLEATKNEILKIKDFYSK